jgi:hypothetical protein
MSTYLLGNATKVHPQHHRQKLESAERGALLRELHFGLIWRSNAPRSAGKRRPNPNANTCADSSGKQQWDKPISPEDKVRGFRGWHERGYLPHCDKPGLVQFITFRL